MNTEAGEYFNKGGKREGEGKRGGGGSTCIVEVNITSFLLFLHAKEVNTRLVNRRKAKERKKELKVSMGCNSFAGMKTGCSFLLMRH